MRVLHGSEEKRIISLGLTEISTYGIMKDIPTSEISDMVNYLIDLGYANKDTTFGAVMLTNKAYAVLRGGQRVMMSYKDIPPKKEKGKGKAKPPISMDSSELFERLRKLRFAIANEQNVPAYIVFSNATLVDMANKKPTVMWEFMEVSGVGRVKADLYGQRFMAEIKDYVDLYGK